MPYQLNEENWGGRDLVAPKWLGYDSGDDDFSQYSDFLLDYAPAGMGWDNPVALYPVQRNYRLHAERGYFTIHGDRPESIDSLNTSCVRRVDLPPNALDDARSFLALAGINDYSMFPDDGLARDLHRKNQLV